MPSHQLALSAKSTNPPIVFTFISDGDANGLFYYLGTNKGAMAWANPNPTYITVVANDTLAGDIITATDRGAATGNWIQPTDNTVGSWVAFDLGAANANFVVASYSARSREGQSGGDRRSWRSWKLQGSNNPASNSVANLAAATWVDIDVRSGDTTMAGGTDPVWAHYSLGATPAAYRWYRIITTDPNDRGGADFYLVMGEFELYGTLTV